MSLPPFRFLPNNKSTADGTLAVPFTPRSISIFLYFYDNLIVSLPTLGFLSDDEFAVDGTFSFILLAAFTSFSMAFVSGAACRKMVSSGLDRVFRFEIVGRELFSSFLIASSSMSYVSIEQ